MLKAEFWGADNTVGARIATKVANIALSRRVNISVTVKLTFVDSEGEDYIPKKKRWNLATTHQVCKQRCAVAR